MLLSLFLLILNPQVLASHRSLRCMLRPNPLLMAVATACLPLRRRRSLLAAVFFLFLVFPALSQASSDAVPANSSNSRSFVFPSFDNVVNGSNLVFFKDAAISPGALQLTPDHYDNVDQLMNKSGNVFLARSFKLWEDLPATATANASQRVASFNTSFNINVYRPNEDIPGDGLAFVIARSLDGPPPGSEGAYLGLTNATLNGLSTNQFVALELDTVMDSSVEDPDDNHVGLDINGVVSNVTASMTRFNISIAPVYGVNYTVWINYDGGARFIRMYMTVVGNPKPASPALQAPLDLSEYLNQHSFFGFAGATGETYQLNCVLAWNLTVEILPEDDNGALSGWKLGAVIGAAALVGLALVVGVVVWMHMRRRRVRDVDSGAVMAGTLRSLPGTPREFEFKELRRATRNFDEKMKLGQGGFGVVYRGILPGENRQLAVKKFSRGSSGTDDFLKELTIINRLRHKHLVPLVGWCHEKGILLLVYEYMPNGSLDQHLYGGDNDHRPLLGWERRYNIVAGVGSALHYLHEEYDQLVIHRDLKSSNVMLDAGFGARLGDFGLARALEIDKTSYAELELAGVPGTLGYIAPECFHTGKATRTSDVFGFGAVVLEVVCGRRPRGDNGQFLTDSVWKLHGDGHILDAVDPRLDGEFDAQDAERLLLLGLACSHPIPSDRPKTETILQILSRSVPPPTVPAAKPSFVWPSGPVDDEEDDRLRLIRRAAMSMSMTSSNYASSAGYTTSQSQYLSRDGPPPV
ncbi:probable L-type lectin-domain containing receptor kinase S.5 [Zingiber officinale]|nr:probable L-type lectin-domain containing receptor kinase S.5 [Zingiber officinale]